MSALALSNLDYCSTVYSNISGDLKERLQRAQNKCIRYVTGLRRDAHVTPRPVASTNQNIWQSFLKRVDVLTLAEVTPSPSSHHALLLRKLPKNLLNMNVQNFGMNCPIEYVTSTPWEDLSLPFLNTFFRMTPYNYPNNQSSIAIEFILYYF